MEELENSVGTSDLASSDSSDALGSSSDITSLSTLSISDKSDSPGSSSVNSTVVQPSPSPETSKGVVAVPSNNGRDARNRAEKLRRDKLNSAITELSTLVPLVVASPRKIDKTGVLRLTAHDLRKEHVFGNSTARCHQKMQPDIANAFLDLFGGFCLTVTYRGLIVIVSANIEQHLGHCQIDLLGQNVLSITHPDDQERMKKLLIPKNIPGFNVAGNAVALPGGSGEGSSTETPKMSEDELDDLFRQERRDFRIRLARAGPRSEPTTYELVHINGCFRQADKAVRGAGAPPCSTQILRRNNKRGEDAVSPSGNDIVFVGMVKILKQSTNYYSNRLLEATKAEYRTRHLIDGRIIQCDQRISIVAGYMTKEVAGLSPFTFMHKEDVRWVMIALRQMYDLSKPVGESCYRLVSRAGTFIYLKTYGYLEVNDDNMVTSFVCINTLVSDTEGKELVRQMKKKYAIIINEEAKKKNEKEMAVLPSANEVTTTNPSVEDPQELEHAIMHLITNLPSPAPCERKTPPPTPPKFGEDFKPPPQYSRAIKSPPLAIIPTQIDSIKSSITRSVQIISSVTQFGSPPESCRSPSSSTETSNNSRPSVLRNVSTQPINGLKQEAMSSQVIKQEPVSPLPSVSQWNHNSHSPQPQVQPSIIHQRARTRYPSSGENSFINSTTNQMSRLNHSNVYSEQLNRRNSELNVNSVHNTSDNIFSGTNQYGIVPKLVNIDNSLQHSSIIVDSGQTHNTTGSRSGCSALKRTLNSDVNNPKRRSVVISDITQDPYQSNTGYGNHVESDSGLSCDEVVSFEEAHSLNIPLQEQTYTPYINQLANSQNTNIETVLPRSLTVLERHMHKIGDSINELQEHFQTYPVPTSSHQQLDEILTEHREQEEILQSIVQDHRTIIQHDSLASPREPRSPHHQTRV